MKQFQADRLQIALRLRRAREAAGLTQGQAAKLLGLHRPAVSEIEAGRRRVSAEELSSLAEAYGVDIAWVAEGKRDGSEETTRLLLAARELSKMRDEDLDRLLSLIQMMRSEKHS